MRELGRHVGGGDGLRAALREPGRLGGGHRVRHRRPRRCALRRAEQDRAAGDRGGEHGHGRDPDDGPPHERRGTGREDLPDERRRGEIAPGKGRSCGRSVRSLTGSPPPGRRRGHPSRRVHGACAPARGRAASGRCRPARRARPRSPRSRDRRRRRARARPARRAAAPRTPDASSRMRCSSASRSTMSSAGSGASTSCDVIRPSALRWRVSERYRRLVTRVAMPYSQGSMESPASFIRRRPRHASRKTTETSSSASLHEAVRRKQKL